MNEVNHEGMKERAKNIMIMADKFSRNSANLCWSLSLRPSEELMLKDVEHEFKLNELFGDDELLKKITRLYFEYAELRTFYIEQAPKVKIRQSMGIYEKKLKYNPDLTIDEACQKYLGCTKREAEESSYLYDRIDDKYQEYLCNIRENYVDSLGTLVGKSDEEYEKRNFALMKSLEESFKQYNTQFNEKLNETFDHEAIGKSLNAISDMLENHGKSGHKK